MSDVTAVDGLTVKGQRRRANGSFPAPPVVSSGGGGETPELIDPEGPPIEDAHPCDDPDAALEWNLDAAAAIALQKMKAKAASLGEPDFAAREYGTAIYRFPDGSIRIGTVSVGTPQAGAVSINYNEHPEEYLVAVIHSHPSPGGFSQDRPVLDYIANVSNYGPMTRLYGVRPTYVFGDPSPRYVLSYYDQTNIDDPSGDGPEVNPEGTPCLGASIS